MRDLCVISYESEFYIDCFEKYIIRISSHIFLKLSIECVVGIKILTSDSDSVKKSALISNLVDVDYYFENL